MAGHCASMKRRSVREVVVVAAAAALVAAAAADAGKRPSNQIRLTTPRCASTAGFSFMGALSAQAFPHFARVDRATPRNRAVLAITPSGCQPDYAIFRDFPHGRVGVRLARLHAELLRGLWALEKST